MTQNSAPTNIIRPDELMSELGIKKDAYYKDSPDENPKGPNKGTERVIRGGSFKSDSNMLRVSARDKAKPTEFANDLGFRCAQSILLPVSASD